MGRGLLAALQWAMVTAADGCDFGLEVFLGAWGATARGAKPSTMGSWPAAVRCEDQQMLSSVSLKGFLRQRELRPCLFERNRRPWGAGEGWERGEPHLFRETPAIALQI